MIGFPIKHRAFLAERVPLREEPTVSHVHNLPTMLQINAIGVLQALDTCFVTFSSKARQVTKGGPVIDGNEQHCLKSELVPFVLIFYLHTVIS